MGKPNQLTKQQVEQIKKANNGSPISTEDIIIDASGIFLKELEIRENDVFLLNIIKN